MISALPCWLQRYSQQWPSYRNSPPVASDVCALRTRCEKEGLLPGRRSPVSWGPPSLRFNPQALEPLTGSPRLCLPPGQGVAP